jgi:hypothetical protein
MYDVNKIEQAVTKILKEYKQDKNNEIKIGVSQRHIHLSREDLDTLFGKGYELTKKKVLMGREYAAEECVTLVGPSLKSIEKVRVLGPVRKNTQVEISKTDTFILKVSPPVRPSGEVKGSEKLVVVGPKGSVYLKEGVIIAYYGDANNDGNVSIDDAMLVAQYVIGLPINVEINTILADVDGDGMLTSIDAMLITQFDVKLFEKFPVER